MAESIRVTRNHVEMVDSIDRGRDGWTLDKGNMDSTKQTWTQQSKHDESDMSWRWKGHNRCKHFGKVSSQGRQKGWNEE